MPGSLYLFTHLILTTRRCSGSSPALLMSRGLTLQKQSPLLLLDLSPQPPSHLHAGRANLGVEEKGFLAPHRDCLIDFFFPKMKTSGFHFISKRMFILATGALWQRNRYKQPAQPAPRALPTCLPLGTHPSHQQLSQGGGKRSHPCPPPGAPKAPPPQPCTAACSPLIL